MKGLQIKENAVLNDLRAGPLMKRLLEIGRLRKRTDASRTFSSRSGWLMLVGTELIIPNKQSHGSPHQTKITISPVLKVA